MDWISAVSSALWGGLHPYQSNQSLSDVTIKVGEREYPCHKIILGALSPYFAAMFASDMMETRNSEVTLPFLDSSTFDRLIRFFYQGQDIVDDESSETILQAACYMQITCLQRRCEEYISGNLSTKNCVHWWQTAKRLSCQSLETKSFEYILNNFESVHNEVLVLDVGDLLSVLQHDQLITPCEELVCDTACKWINHDLENRKGFATDIMEILKLPLTKGSYVLEFINRQPFTTENFEGKTFVDEALRYHVVCSERKNFSSSRIEPRECADTEQMLIVMCGATGQKAVCTKAVYGYSFRAKRWIQLEAAPHSLGGAFGACAYDENVIYVSGMSTGESYVFAYNCCSNSWTEHPAVVPGRRRHEMVAFPNKIFILGGFIDVGGCVLNDIQEYDVKASTWKQTGTLLHPVMRAASAVADDKIFLFGGSESELKNVDTVQCFDTRLRSTYIVCNLPCPEHQMRAIHVNNRIVLFTTKGAVLEFVQNKEVVRLGELDNFEREYFAAVHHRGVAILLGGAVRSCGSWQPFNDCLMFNLDDNKLRSTDITLPISLFGFGCGVICVGKRSLVSEDEML